MEIVWKSVGIVLTASAFGLVLRKNVPEMELLLVLAVTAVVLGLGLSLFPSVMSFLDRLGELSGAEESTLSILWRGAAIAVVTRFASELCGNAGYRSFAEAVEFVGRTCMLWQALPILEEVLDTVRKWEIG